MATAGAVELFNLSRDKYMSLKEEGVISESLDDQFDSNFSQYTEHDKVKLAQVTNAPHDDAIGNAMAEMDGVADIEVEDIDDLDELLEELEENNGGKEGEK